MTLAQALTVVGVWVMKMRSLVLCGILLLALPGSIRAEEVSLVCGAGSARVDFGVRRLEAALKGSGKTLERHTTDKPPPRIGILVLANFAEAQAFIDLAKPLGADPAIQGEGYRIVRTSWKGAGLICLSAKDETGAMYALLDLAEQVRMTGGLAKVEEKLSNPRFAFRAIKFNLPWMSYRKHESLQLHIETCRDLKFWEQFLDMMAENRFNALTLWNLHPFTFMIRPKNFPEACPFDDRELAEWQDFWKKLFRMAKDRGIETYMVNWNIFVSPELAKAHGVSKYSVDWSIGGNGDTSELVRRYTRECVTQVIDEYGDLTGLGITLGERMGGMTPRQREDWLLETFGAGMKAAKRPVKFIHRAPLSADTGSGGSTDGSTPLITRDGVDKMGLASPPWVEMKFNWSHAFSSPRLCIIHGGKASEVYFDPKPTNYSITWMMRNEDFFILRWGEPGFIRKHIEANGKDYVGGYFVGSECYIPAKNYLDKTDLPERIAYAFQRQWLFYQLWGRLLYDPATPDAVLESEFDARYGAGVGRELLAAYQAASRMPQHLASFYRSTWDFTLYSEGFMAPAGAKGAFISIDALIKTATLDPAYVSITEYVQAVAARRQFDASRLTPPALADALEKDAEEAMKHLAGLTGKSAALDHEIADVQAWAWLSRYFADKLRAGVALQTFRTTHNQPEKNRAVELLERAAGHWDQLIAVTQPLYPEVPVIHLGNTKFSWANCRDQVRKDIETARNEK